jgi:hypothetical protein
MGYSEYRYARLEIATKLDALEAEYIAANRIYANGEMVKARGKKAVIKSAFIGALGKIEYMYSFVDCTDDAYPKEYGTAGKQILTKWI